MRILTGVEEIDNALAELDKKSANRIARSSVNAGLRVGLKAVKNKTRWRSGKKAMGSRLKKTRSSGNMVEGKLGAGVGQKKTRPVPARKQGRPGVGLSTNNIHWPLLGTKQRTQKKTGRNTGAMPKHFIIKRAVSGAAPEIRQKMVDQAKASLEREVNRVRG